MKPALLVIDTQKEFLKSDPLTAQSMQNSIPAINMAMTFFRKKGLPVVCIQHMDREDGLVPGSDGFDLPEELAIQSSDIHIIKTYGNAFNKTPLLDELQKLGVDTVFISGYCAEYCVLNTCRDAKDVDLVPILVRGCLASGNAEHIRFVEEINEVVSLRALQTILDV